MSCGPPPPEPVAVKRLDPQSPWRQPSAGPLLTPPAQDPAYSLAGPTDLHTFPSTTEYNRLSRDWLFRCWRLTVSSSTCEGIRRTGRRRL